MRDIVWDVAHADMSAVAQSRNTVNDAMQEVNIGSGSFSPVTKVVDSQARGVHRQFSVLT